MSDDYAKGYAAGRRRKTKDAQASDARKKQDAFWQRAFLAALPGVINAENWKRNDKPITGLKERVRLAKDFADEALTVAKSRI